MKIINVQGTHHTGKTTTCAEIIKELRRRGYSVGSIKSIHFEAFTMETEGSNTHTHKMSGANPVTALGLYETDIMFKGRREMDTLLSSYDCQWLVIEGHIDNKKYAGGQVAVLPCPNIIVGITETDLDKQLNDKTIACSGIIANDYVAKAPDEEGFFRGLPVINALTDVGRLVDLAEEKTRHYIPRRTCWQLMWQEMNDAQERSSSVNLWNEAAANFRKKAPIGKRDEYVEQFYELSQIEPGETIFDMGCGSGTLAIPFAQRGHHIWAADFSPEMLKHLMAGAKEAGVEHMIHPIQLDWNEDWTKRSLPVCDVAIASRSLIFEDLTASLKKLESVAGRRVCLGAWDTPVPEYDRHVARAIGYERPGYGCHYIIMGELMERDVYPELKYIRSPFRLTKFQSRQQAYEVLSGTFRYGLTKEQKQKLKSYLDEHLKYHEEEGECAAAGARGDAHGQSRYWQLDHDDMSTIAFISWDKMLLKQHFNRCNMLL